MLQNGIFLIRQYTLFSVKDAKVEMKYIKKNQVSYKTETTFPQKSTLFVKKDKIKAF